MQLKKLQTTLTTGERALRLMLQLVVLQLAAVRERLVALAALEGGGSLVAHLMPLKVGIRGKFHATLRADMAPSSFVLDLVSTEFAGVGKTATTKSATVGLDISVLQHVPLQVTGLGEALFAHCAFMRPRTLVRQQVRL